MKGANIALWSLMTVSVAVASLLLWLWIRERGRSEDTSRIELRDQSGGVRVRLTATNAGGSIELVDEKGNVRLALRQETSRTAVEINRTDPTSKAIELMVASEKDRSPATLSLFSKSGEEATLGADETTWMKLRSNSGEFAIKHRSDRSEITGVHAGKAVRYEIDAAQSRFTTDMPMFVNLNPTR